MDRFFIHNNAHVAMGYTANEHVHVTHWERCQKKQLATSSPHRRFELKIAEKVGGLGPKFPLSFSVRVEGLETRLGLKQPGSTC